jgi:AAA+ ATPase superfamily predicted ATPase
MPGFADASYRDWPSLFRALSREAERSKWRGPLILDEFPYLFASSKELASVLQAWFDHEARRAKLAVAIAGSSQRMMQGFVLDPSSPLYGRSMEAFEVLPLSPAYLGRALGLADPARVVEAYSVWGGIPRYWELAESFGERLDDAVDTCVLDPRGPLHLEPDRLLLEETPPAIALRPLLDAIGMGANRVSELAGRIGQAATSLVRPLSRLTQLGIVRRELPYGVSEKSSKRSLYKIQDSFFRFWFRVVAPHRALLAQAPAPVRRDLWRRAKPGLVADAWEDLCRTCTVALGASAGHGLAELGPWRPAGRYWRGTGPKWDVVSSSLDERRILLGEVKWMERPADRSALEVMASRLVAKGRPEIGGDPTAEIVRVLFVPRVRHRAGRVDSVHIVTAADVIEASR